MTRYVGDSVIRIMSTSSAKEFTQILGGRSRSSRINDLLLLLPWPACINTGIGKVVAIPLLENVFITTTKQRKCFRTKSWNKQITVLVSAYRSRPAKGRFVERIVLHYILWCTRQTVLS